MIALCILYEYNELPVTISLDQWNANGKLNEQLLFAFLYGITCHKTEILSDIVKKTYLLLSVVMTTSKPYSGLVCRIIKNPDGLRSGIVRMH